MLVIWRVSQQGQHDNDQPRETKEEDRVVQVVKMADNLWPSIWLVTAWLGVRVVYGEPEYADLGSKQEAVECALG